MGHPSPSPCRRDQAERLRLPDALPLLSAPFVMQQIKTSMHVGLKERKGLRGSRSLSWIPSLPSSPPPSVCISHSVPPTARRLYFTTAVSSSAPNILCIRVSSFPVFHPHLSLFIPETDDLPKSLKVIGRQEVSKLSGQRGVEGKERKITKVTASIFLTGNADPPPWSGFTLGS